MRLLLTAVALVFATSAIAKDISPMELVRSGPEIVGEVVVLNGCRWRHADIESMGCDAYEDGQHVTLIWADLQEKRPTELLPLIKRCGGFELKDECSFPVKGMVAQTGKTPRLRMVQFELPAD